MSTSFRRLNDDWNADPNVPAEAVSVAGDTVALEFTFNQYAYAGFAEDERGRLTFTGCTKFRVGSTNDEVYEITGDLFDERVSDWTPVPSRTPGPRRRFLFYLRDNTFEVDAQDWRIERLEPVAG